MVNLFLVDYLTLRVLVPLGRTVAASARVVSLQVVYFALRLLYYFFDCAHSARVDFVYFQSHTLVKMSAEEAFCLHY